MANECMPEEAGWSDEWASFGYILLLKPFFP